MQTGEPSGLQRVLDALNVLGKTRWCVVLSVLCVEPRSLTYRAGESMTTCCQSWSRFGKTAAAWRRFLRPRCVACPPVSADGCADNELRAQDLILPIMPSPTFTLHTYNLQQLCYGSKLSVRLPCGLRRDARLVEASRVLRFYSVATCANTSCQ